MGRRLLWAFVSAVTLLALASCAGLPSGKTPSPEPSSSKSGLKSIDHVVFMLQENRSFDSYFGMLNPYRVANKWNVGEDGNAYTVDGIDDKLSQIMNVNDEGQSFGLFKLTTTCVDDMTSAWLESYGDVNRYNFTSGRPILMDGFVHVAENLCKIGTG